MGTLFYAPTLLQCLKMRSTVPTARSSNTRVHTGLVPRKMAANARVPTLWPNLLLQVPSERISLKRR